MMKKTMKLTTTAMMFAALTVACAKKREAALAEADQASVFALSEFGDVDTEKSPYSFRTMNDKKQFTAAEGALAMNEKDVVTVDQSGLNVPERLKPMFKNLQISAEGGREYKVAFAIDREFLVAYRSIGEGEQLSVLDQALRTTANNVSLEIAAQKGTTSEPALKAARIAREQAIKGEAKMATIVPIFKYKLDDMGTLGRKRNESGDETTVLEIKKAAIEKATHVKLDVDSSKRLTVAEDAKVLQNVYLIDRLTKTEGLKAGAMKKALMLPMDVADDADIKIALTDKEMVVSTMGSEGAPKEVKRLKIAYITLETPDRDNRIEHARVNKLDFSEKGDATSTNLVKIVVEEAKKDTATAAAQAAK